MADAGNKDSCNGDSGSPVAWLDPQTQKQTVVGVIILGSEEPSNDQRCGAVGRHSVCPHPVHPKLSALPWCSSSVHLTPPAKLTESTLSHAFFSSLISTLEG